MFKVADYLIQSQARPAGEGFAELRPLDTRGAGHAVSSALVLCGAMFRLIAGRASSHLAGVHVNMAEKLSCVRKGAVVLMSRALGVPVVLHLHAAELPQFYRRLPGPFQAMLRFVFARATTCVVLGEASRRFVTEELRVPADRVQIVINGVPDPRGASAPPREPGRQRILFLGNLSERKGVSDLLAALARPGFRREALDVRIAGGGDVEGYARRARELGVADFVHFEGWADQAKATRLLASADVLVLPSYDEGLPLVILEALANGVAVVCTPVGEIPGTLTDGVDACFVRPGDTASIAEGLQRVLDDDALRESLGRNGRALYDRGFSLRRFFQSIADIHRRHFGISARLGAPE
jgi:glycosyltransferase involved in cell wall biosynthesis